MVFVFCPARGPPAVIPLSTWLSHRPGDGGFRASEFVTTARGADRSLSARPLGQRASGGCARAGSMCALRRGGSRSLSRLGVAGPTAHAVYSQIGPGILAAAHASSHARTHGEMSGAKQSALWPVQRDGSACGGGVPGKRACAPAHSLRPFTAGALSAHATLGRCRQLSSLLVPLAVTTSKDGYRVADGENKTVGNMLRDRGSEE